MADFFRRPDYQAGWTSTYRRRYILIILILSLAALALIGRLVYLTVINRAFLKGQGDARTLRTVEVPAYRGMILDRNGEPLAISTPVASIWFNPQDFNPSSSQINVLANLLSIPRSEIKSRLSDAGDREFVYIKRGVDPEIGKEIKSLNIPGLYIQDEYRRFYPEGEVMAHVLGFTNVDDHGEEGLELAYNSWLQGVTGIQRELRDRFGHVVADVSVIRSPKPGQNITLSIDRRIQYFAYQELKKGVDKYKADSGSVVVIDPNTGEILAMVNWPSYNPNNRPDNSDGRYRNRAVTDLFEPGSTIKSFSMASALTSGKFQVNSRINTSPGVILVNGKKVDDDGHDNGVIDLTRILAVSSNVGMAKIITSLPPQNLWNMLHAVGFGQVTESNFPGERSGVLVNYPVWDPFVLATNSFGYGLSVTALQLAKAYCVLATGGIKRPVTFIKTDTVPQGEEVIKPQVAKDILKMLQSVLMDSDATAPEARVPGYLVTGKTGTARMLGPHGYDKTRHNGMFVGIAPATHPRLVIAVVLHDLHGPVYFAGYTSGPVFSRIMGESLRLLNVPPDDLNQEKSKKSGETAAKPPEGFVD